MKEGFYNSPVTINKQGKRFTGSHADLKAFAEILKKEGVDGWNSWVNDNEKYDIDLRGISLSNVDLSGIDLMKANLSGARIYKSYFTNAHLNDVQLNDSIIRNTNFDSAVLTYSNFINSRINESRMVVCDLTNAQLQGAKLKNVNLSYSNLSGVDLTGATLHALTVTGTNTWGIKTENTKQKGLKIEPWIEPLQEFVDDSGSGIDNIILEVNDIEVAQLLYLLKQRDKKGKSIKVKSVIDALTEKIVLILGNFGVQKFAILHSMREKLASKGYVPVIFNFKSPEDRDLIETVAILAGLSRFVIADFTSQTSTPLEALLIISGYKVPFAPIILKGKKIFGMFESLQEKYDWVLDHWEYKNKNHLMKNLQLKIIDPCEAKRKQYAERKKKIEKLRLQNALGKHLRGHRAVAAKAKGE